MTTELLIGTVSACASLGSILLSKPNWKSKIIHVVYTAFICGLIFFMTSEMTEVSKELDEANDKIARLESIQRQAKSILGTIPTYASDPGTNRGTVLKVLAFLEKHKDEIPDTYVTVQNLAEGVGLTERSKGYFEGGKEHNESLGQAAKAAREIVEGLAAGG